VLSRSARSACSDRANMARAGADNGRRRSPAVRQDQARHRAADGGAAPLLGQCQAICGAHDGCRPRLQRPAGTVRRAACREAARDLRRRCAIRFPSGKNLPFSRSARTSNQGRRRPFRHRGKYDSSSENLTRQPRSAAARLPRRKSKLRFQNTPPALKQHVADPCRLHHVRLHLSSRLVDAPRDLLLRLHDFRMV